MDEITDKLAHHRIDTLDREHAETRAIANEARAAFIQLDKNSEVRHAMSQAQNAQILERLNQPSVIMSILGDPVKITGIVTLLGALLSGAVALGYAQAPTKPVLVPVPVEAAHTPTP